MKTLVTLLMLAACSTSPIEQEKKPTKASWPNSAWQNYAYEKSIVLPRTTDEKEWCQNGFSNRANFVHLLAAMAKMESNFKPRLEYEESFKNGRGERVISTGLFQVSYESARGYGFSGVTTEQLKDPYKNIDVAISILKKWAERDGVISNSSGTTWRGGARYWSVLRHSRWDSRAKKWVPNSANKRLKEYLKGFCE